LVSIRIFVGFFFLVHLGAAQNADIDSLRNRLSQELPDTSRVNVLARIGFEYAFVDSDTSRFYSNQAVQVAESINFVKGKADALNVIGISYDIQGDYNKSLGYFLEALSMYEELEDQSGMARAYNNVGMVYNNLNDADKSLEYHFKSYNQEKLLGDSSGIAYSMIHLGELYREQNNLDSSQHYFSESIRILEKLGDEEGLTYAYNGMGNLFLTNGKIDEALTCFKKSYKSYKKTNNKIGLAETSLLMGNALTQQGNSDSSYYYYSISLENAQVMGALNIQKEATEKISSWHEQAGDYKEALNLFKQNSQLKDSILNEEKFSELAKIQSGYDLLEKEKEILLINKEKEFQRILLMIFLLLIVGIMIVGLIFYRNYRLKIKAYLLLERKNAEIERKNIQIEAERKNALQATEAKAKFLSSMSHEIRTPLHAIIGISQLLNENSFEGGQKENLKALKFSAENLLVMVSDVLDFSKIEANKVEFEEISFDFQELLENIKRTFQPKSKEKGLEWKVTFENDVPKTLIGDPGKLIQVLTNLVNNAIKFTNEGSVHLKVKVISQLESDVRLHFSIIDTGIGIPKDYQASILDPFSQANSNLRGEIGGTGLGLSIVKKLLENRGSTIQFQSMESEGSKFYFDLNFKVGDSSSQSIKEYPTFRSLQGTKILLVEDNKINELLGVRLLESWDVSVDVASTGVQAIDMVLINNYDIVLMDVLMPEMDGIEATKRIRKLKGEKFKHLPIIALTAIATVETKEEILQSGMNDFISKPFNINDLYSKIENYLIKKNLGSLWSKESN